MLFAAVFAGALQSDNVPQALATGPVLLVDADERRLLAAVSLHPYVLLLLPLIVATHCRCSIKWQCSSGTCNGPSAAG